jgi:vacuolar-type H+-ATPase subunit F/Vma7
VKVVLLGTEEDVRGFRLAGVDGRVCTDRGSLEASIASLRPEPEIGLILFSASVAAAAPSEIDHLRGPRRVVLVLPEVPPRERP